MLRVSLAVLLALAPSIAWADDEAASNERFREGRELWEQGSYLEACAKFEESHRLGSSVGNLLNLGRCAERSGMLATAWRHYRASADLASKHGEPERGRIAVELAATLAPRLATVDITLRNRPAGLEVRVDGRTIDAAELRKPVALDPGEHRISAAAAGHASTEAAVTVSAEGERHEVTLELVAVEAPTPPESGLRTMGIAGWIAGGVGVAGLAVGAILGGMALATRDRIKDEECDAEGDGTFSCSPEGADDIEGLRAQTTGSTIAFIAGGVLTALGITLVIVDATSGADTRVAAGPLIGPATIGFQLIVR